MSASSWQVGLAFALVGLFVSGSAWALECPSLMSPEEVSARQVVLANHQKRTRDIRPFDTSIVHLETEDIYTTLRDINEQVAFGRGSRPELVAFGFYAAPVSSNRGFIPTLRGPTLLCLLPFSVGVFISDGFTHHVTELYRLDVEAEKLWFADIWPDNFLLAQGRNALGIAAEVRQEGDTVLHGISVKDAMRVVVGAVLGLNGELQLNLPRVLMASAQAREKSRVALGLANAYEAQGAEAVKYLTERDVAEVPDAERNAAIEALDFAGALGTDLANLTIGSSPPSACPNAASDVRRTIRADRTSSLAFRLLKLAGPLASFCPPSQSAPALEELAAAMPDELEAAYWAARSHLMAGEDAAGDRLVKTMAMRIADETERMIDAKAGDKRAYLRGTVVDTPSYTRLRFWDREVRRLDIAMQAHGGSVEPALERVSELLSDSPDWRDFDLASTLLVVSGQNGAALDRSLTAVEQAEGPVAFALARRVLELYRRPGLWPATRAQVKDRLPEIQSKARQVDRVPEASLYAVLFEMPKVKATAHPRAEHHEPKARRAR